MLTYITQTNLPTQAWMARGEPGAQVVVTTATTTITTEIDAKGRWSATIPLQMGLNEVSVVLTDGAGNTSAPYTYPIRRAPSVPDVGMVHVATGSLQVGEVEAFLMRPIQVVATDAEGDPVIGQSVVFRVVEGDGWLALEDGGAVVGTEGAAAELIVQTNAEGRAQVWWKLGPLAGAKQQAMAWLAGDTGLPAVFDAKAVPAVTGPTSISGRVLDIDRRGVPGVTITIIGTPVSTVSDDKGSFTLHYGPTLPEPFEPHAEHLLVDGFTATTGTHARIAFEVDVLPGRDNAPTRPFYLPKIPAGVELPLDGDGVMTEDLVLAARIGDEVNPTRVFVAAGTKVTWPASIPPDKRKLSLLTIPSNRTPMPLGDGYYSRHVIAVQPGTTKFEPPLSVEFPNVDAIPPGDQVVLRSFDHDAGRYVAVGTATASADGTVVRTDPGSGIRFGAWHDPPPKKKSPPCVIKYTVKAPPGSSDTCVCDLPNGTTVDCKPGETVEQTVPCDGDRPDSPESTVEARCEEEEKSIDITGPESVGPGRDEEYRGETSEDVECVEEEYRIDGRTPEAGELIGSGDDIQGVKLTDAFIKANAGKTVVIQYRCTTADGDVLVASKEVEILGACCEAKGIRACADEMVESETANAFTLKGNVQWGLSNGELFLKTPNDANCRPGVQKLILEGSDLTMQTRIPFVGVVPDFKLHRGNWFVDAFGVAKVHFGDIGNTGATLFTLVGFPISTEDNAVVGLKSLTYAIPKIELPLGEKLKLSFEGLTIATDGIFPIGVIEIKRIQLIPKLLGVDLFQLGFDLQRERIFGSIRLLFDTLPAEGAAAPGNIFELIGEYRKGSLQSIEGSVEFNPPIIPVPAQPLLQLRKAGVAFKGLGFLNGTNNEPPRVDFKGQVDFGKAVQFAGKCFVLGQASDLVLGLAFDPFSLAFDAAVKAVVISKRGDCQPVDPDTVGLLEASAELRASLIPPQATVNLKVKMRSDIVRKITGILGEKFPNFFKKDDETGKPPETLLNGQLKGVIAASPFVAYVFANLGITIPAVRVFFDKVELIPEQLAQVRGIFLVDTKRVKLEVSGRLKVAGVGNVQANVKMQINFFPPAGGKRFDLSGKVCVRGRCFPSSIDLDRRVFADGQTSFEVPAGLSALEIELDHDETVTVDFAVDGPDGLRLAPDETANVPDGIETYFVAGIDPETSVWVIENPIPGTYTVSDVVVTNADGSPGSTASVTELVFAIPDEAPFFFFDETTPVSDDPAGKLLTFETGDADSGATIQFFYDTDTEPGDEILIAEVVAASDEPFPTSFLWETSGVVPGTYFVKVVMTDDETPPIEVTLDTPVIVEGDGSLPASPLLVQADPIDGGLAVSWLPGAVDEEVSLYAVTMTPVDAVDANETTRRSVDGRTMRLTCDGLRPGRAFYVSVTATNEEAVTSAPSPPVMATAGGAPGLAFVSRSTTQVRVGQTFTYAPEFSGGEGVGNVTLAKAPTTMSVVGGVVTWTPSAADSGVHEVVVTASDTAIGARGASQSFDLTVVGGELVGAPEFVTVPPASGQVGVEYEYAFAATSPEGDVTVALDSGPDGMSIDGDGVLRWTPTAEQASVSKGVVVYRLSVTDDALGETRQTGLVRFDDPDDDGLDTGFERASGLDPFTPDDPDADPDSDNLTHAQEAALGTRGDQADSDGDGLDDDVELDGTSDPRVADTDGDGLNDGEEAAAGTDPLLSDSDGDGVGDKAEVDGGSNANGGAPDSDGDGLSDDFEDANGLDSAVADSDGDGCSDGEELAAKTLPGFADSDGDGVGDCDELTIGTDPLTRPTDSDGDGLFDDREVLLGTDRNSVDTDGDGFEDGTEVKLGTDPLDGDSVPEGIDGGTSVRSVALVGASTPKPFLPESVVELGLITVIRDDDFDGIPNTFEAQHGFDARDPSDGSLDFDNDGLTNFQEFKAGTDPTKADSDGDGVPDGQELQDGTDPTDDQSFATGGPAVSLTVTPAGVVLRSNTLFGVGEQQLRVVGVRGDGTEVDLTLGSTGTTYLMAGPAVASVGADGRLVGSIAAGSGETSVIVQNGTLSVDVPISATVLEPAGIARLPLPGVPGPLAVDGATLAVVEDGNVRLVDVTTPANPTLAGLVELGTAEDVSIRTGRVAVAMGLDGLGIIDASDRNTPVLVARVPMPSAHAVSMRGGYAWVASDAGLQLVDTTAPGLGLIDQNGDGSDDRILATKLGLIDFVDVDHSLDRGIALTADGDLWTFTIPADPTGTTFVGTLTPGTPVAGVLAQGALGYAAGFDQLHRLSLNTPPAFSLSSDPGAGLNAAGFLATYQDVVVVARKQSAFLTTWLRPGAAEIAVLGSINYAAIGAGTSTHGLAVQGDYHYVTASLGANRALIVGQHDERVDLLGVPPKVELLAPDPGAEIEEGELVDIVLSVTDDVGIRSVELLVDGEVVATDTEFPFEASVKLPLVQSDTPLVITATATDFGDNVGQMEPATITVIPVIDIDPPTIGFLTPFDGAAVSGSTNLPVEVKVIDEHAIAEVRYFLDGDLVATADAPPFTAAVPIPTVAASADKKMVLRAEAVDIGDNVGATEIVLNHAGIDLVAQGITFIAADDATLDGADIFIGGGQVEIAGVHAFDRVFVSPSGVLTHPHTTLTEDASLEIVANAVVVESGGRIDVSERGKRGACRPDGHCTAAELEGHAAKFAGGSHGGRGAGSSPEPLGDPLAPFDLGLGGGHGNGGSEDGGHGGGRFKLTTDTLTLDGDIRADGQAALDVFGRNGGGGAGGSVQVVVGELAGSGQITAIGGTSPLGNGGGGGRIAVRVTAGTSSANLDATGGAAGGGQGAPGTIYLEQQGVTPQLLIDAGDLANVPESASLGTVTSGQAFGAGMDFVVRGGAAVIMNDALDAATVLVDGPSRLVAFEALDTATLTLTNGAVLTQQNATLAYQPRLDVTATTVAIDATSAIDLTGRGFLGACQPDGHCSAAEDQGHSARFSGGSYGGRGAGPSNTVYGDLFDPDELGFGGGHGNGSGEDGGDGGGRLRLVADSLDLQGAIRADGAAAATAFSGNGGGGAGGAIRVDVIDLTGAGGMSARGGDSPAGTGGGGGRIAVRVSGSGAVVNTTAAGGEAPGGNGAPGSIYLEEPGANPTIVIDGAAIAGATESQTLGTVSTGATFGQGMDVRITNGAQVRLNEALDVASLTIDGQSTLVAFESVTTPVLVVQNGSTLSSQSSSQTYETRLDINATSVTVDATSAIDVAGRGHLGACTPSGQCGAGEVGGHAAIRSGGSHGARGAGESPASFGDYLDPDTLGMGGGHGNGSGEDGGNGGGRVRIVADTLILDGQLTADGYPALDAFVQNGGGGAGGSIRIDVATMGGSGALRARGGSSPAGTGGGGGRIAVRVTGTNTFDLPGQLSTSGGDGPTGAGGAGSIYVEAPGLPPELRFDNEGLVAAQLSESLGATTGTAFGAGTAPLVVLDGARVILNDPIDVVSLTIDQSSELHVLGGVTAPTVTIANGSALQTESVDATTLDLAAAAELRSHATTLAADSRLDVSATTIGVDATSVIDVSGLGGLGACVSGGNCSSGAVAGHTKRLHGGSYGGRGGSADIDTSYGSVTVPDDVGLGGGNGNGSGETGGNGGGRLHLVATNLTMEGAIRADGRLAGTAFAANGGGGAGGAVRVEAETYSGAGEMTARGGDSTSGAAGGGGRIAVRISGSGAVATLSARGGVGPVQNGAPGSTYVELPGQAPQLFVDAEDLAGVPESSTFGTEATGGVFGTGMDIHLLRGANVRANEALDALTLRVADGSRFVAWQAITATSVDIANGSTLSQRSTALDVETRLDVTVDSLSLDGTSTIDLTGRGYLGACVSGGNCASGAIAGHAARFGGGAHGGLGGGASDAVHGDPLDPDDLGSGGGQGNGSGETGGNGGGRLKLLATTLALDGTIHADGSAASTAFGANGGGGAGGTVNIAVTDVTGSGSVSALGGPSVAGTGGAGGRVAVRITGSGSVAPIEAHGGAGPGGDGGAGTVYVEFPGQTPALTVDGNDLDTPESAAFGAAATGDVFGVGVDVTLRGGARVVAMDPLELASLSVSGGSRLVVFDSLTTPTLALEGGSVLSHHPTRLDYEGRLDIEATTVTIDATSSIDVTGRGYLGGCAVGGDCNAAERLGHAARFAAASHGGRGGGASNAVYDVLTAPDGLGFGGGQGTSSGDRGGNGGGRVSLSATTLALDGTIVADGLGGTGPNTSSGGGGAGGGVRVVVDSLSGSGSIRAHGGGAVSGPGGGGGRVAVTAEAVGDFDLARVTAYAGIGTTVNGNPGSVAHLASGELTELRLAAGGLAQRSFEPPWFEIGVHAADKVEPGSIRVAGTPWIPDTLAGLRVGFDGTDKTYEIVSNSSNELFTAVSDDQLSEVATAGTRLFGVRAAGRIRVTGGFVLQTRDHLHAGELQIDGDAVVSHPNVADDGTEYSVDITLTGALTVASDGAIDVTGAGHMGACRGGSCTTAISVGHSGEFSGGTHAGLGGGANPLAPVFGDAAEPVTTGTGGGRGTSDQEPGGHGGGRIHIVAGSASLEGVVKADGGAAPQQFNRDGSGGAGGSVWIEIDTTVTGAGSISANGGASDLSGGGGGGGGRVALYAEDGTAFPPSTVDGGTGVVADGAVGSVVRATTLGSGSVCTSDSECGVGGRCDGGSCATLSELGSGCTADGECGSGHCVDGVCCGSSCALPCSTCDATPGTCTVTAGCEAPADCSAVLTADPGAPTGLYVIDPTGGSQDDALLVHCNMDAAFGGWARVFFDDEGSNFNTASLGYDVGDPELLAAASEAMIAYVDPATGVVAELAFFGIPADWQVAAPFEYDQVDVELEVFVNASPIQTTTLRYGNDSFTSTCDGNWGTGSFGRVCVLNSLAPFYTGFASSDLDRCALSNEAFNGTACSATRRFAIYVR